MPHCEAPRAGVHRGRQVALFLALAGVRLRFRRAQEGSAPPDPCLPGQLSQGELGWGRASPPPRYASDSPEEWLGVAQSTRPCLASASCCFECPPRCLPQAPASLSAKGLCCEQGLGHIPGKLRARGFELRGGVCPQGRWESCRGQAAELGLGLPRAALVRAQWPCAAVSGPGGQSRAVSSSGPLCVRGSRAPCSEFW